MKSNGKRERLVVLLARGFLGFTITLVFILALVLKLSSEYYDWLSRIPDYDRLRNSDAFVNEKYDEVKIAKYLGKKGAFAIVNEDGTITYRTSNIFPESFTAEEIRYIQGYEEMSYIDSEEMLNKDGEKEYRIAKYYYDENEIIPEYVVILDKNYNVKSGGLGDGRSSYTESEIKCLRGTRFPNFDMMKIKLKPSEDGSQQYMITLSEVFDFEEYKNMSSKAERIYFLLIPLYLIALIFFLGWLNQKIKKPLSRLNAAVDGLAVGGEVRLGEMEGPWEIRKIGENIDRMSDMLSESEKERIRMDGERKRLLADISHDLKTPITVISGYTNAIRDGKVPPEKINDYLEKIDKKAEELTYLVNSFHEYSKVEHPQFILKPDRVDVCEFIRGYLAERYDEIKMAGFSLIAQIPEKKIICRIDGAQMTRAIDNIIYNTIKYNSLGTVLAVSVIEAYIEGSRNVSIKIADNGVGIPEEQRENIFKPFVRGSKERTGTGSGLGLSISQKIVTAHGGNLSLCEQNTGGYSTVFEIKLPVYYVKP